jgi:hypothetical protein
MSYIARIGRYEKRGDKVRLLASLNMPPWASTQDGAAYWKAADSTRNRANARLGYLVEYALPRELSIQAQSKLAGEFASAIAVLSAEGIGPRGAVPVTYGIHEGYGRNPHVHMLIGTSISDGIRRAPGAWFMRHNPKNPEKGGALRSRSMAKTKWLERVRELWAELANHALAVAGLTPTLDHRSHAARGILSEPGIHLGPSAAHLLRQNRPAPRVEKHNAVGRRNKLLADLQDQIELHRRRLKFLELQTNVDEQARRIWQTLSNLTWQHLFIGHPLAGDAKSVRSSAKICVIESDLSNAKAVHDAALSNSFQISLTEKIEHRWDRVVTREGMWLVQSNRDAVVFVGPGYVATDSSDDDSVSALVIAASALPFKLPVIAVQASVHDKVVDCLMRFGLSWPLRIVRGNNQKQQPGPK